MTGSVGGGRETPAKRAAKHLSFGHFADGSGGSYVRCPDCRERVHSPWSPLERRNPTAQLRDLLAEHFRDGCEVPS